MKTKQEKLALISYIGLILTKISHVFVCHFFNTCFCLNLQPEHIECAKEFAFRKYKIVVAKQGAVIY